MGKNTRQLLLIAAIIVIVFIILVLLFLLRFTQAPTKIPTATVSPTPGRISIANIPVNNFFENSSPINREGDLAIDVKPSYQIIYLNQFQQFIISIDAKPFQEVRQKAEQAFLAKLGISQKDACKLDVSVSTTNDVDPSFAGKRYKLSFCE